MCTLHAMLDLRSYTAVPEPRSCALPSRSLTLHSCAVCGEMQNVYMGGGSCIKFSDNKTLAPLCCGCGTGLVKKGGAPPAAEEMER